MKAVIEFFVIQQMPFVPKTSTETHINLWRTDICDCSNLRNLKPRPESLFFMSGVFYFHQIFTLECACCWLTHLVLFLNVAFKLQDLNDSSYMNHFSFSRAALPFALR